MMLNKFASTILLMLLVSLPSFACDKLGGFFSRIDGVAVDNRTGLMWKRCFEGYIYGDRNCSGSLTSLTWQDALNYVVSVNNGNVGENYNFTDWRLPSIKELSTIMDFTCNGDVLSKPTFPLNSAPTIWTTTTVGDRNLYALRVTLTTGFDQIAEKSIAVFNGMLLVRGGR